MGLKTLSIFLFSLVGCEQVVSHTLGALQECGRHEGLAIQVECLKARLVLAHAEK